MTTIEKAAGVGTPAAQENYGRPNHSASLTILTTRGGLKLAKTWLADGSIADYDDSKHYTHESRPVANLAQLHTILAGLAGRPNACVIRGRLKDVLTDPDLKPGLVLRRKSCFDDVPRPYAMFDVDGFECDWAADPEAAFKAWIRQVLPAEFHAAGFVWQLSGSAGHPKKPGLRGHVWFWFDSPIDSASLRGWATAYKVATDRSVFDSIQVHYTANPVFAPGTADPVWERMGFVPGGNVALVYDPTLVAEQVARAGGADMVDPRTKSGLVGAVCRALSPADVLGAEWFRGNFVHATGHRWTWLDGGGAKEGVFVTETHLCNVHNTAPQDTIARAINTFDLVRLYNFGDLDDPNDENAWLWDTDPTARPSYRATREWALSLPEVQAQLPPLPTPAPGQQTTAAPDGNVIVDLSAIGGTLPELPQDWMDTLIPAGVVTLLGGHGGSGKSILALIMAVHLACGRPFAGRTVRPARVLFMSCEDDGARMLHRLKRVLNTFAIDLAEIRDHLRILDMTGGDPTLYEETGRSGFTTKAYDWLAGQVEEFTADVVIVDNASDAFGANENARPLVRAFIRSMAQLIQHRQGAVLLLAHIDKAAARGGGGGENYSGSTAWNNSVRSRMAITSPSDGELILTQEKANHGKKVAAIPLTWKGSVPVPRHGGDPFSMAEESDKADLTILRLIAEHYGRGSFISPEANAKNQASSVLVGDPECRADKSQVKVAVLNLERRGLLSRCVYHTHQRKNAKRWEVTEAGRSALGAPCAPCCAIP